MFVHVCVRTYDLGFIPNVRQRFIKKKDCIVCHYQSRTVVYYVAVIRKTMYRNNTITNLANQSVNDYFESVQ